MIKETTYYFSYNGREYEDVPIGNYGQKWVNCSQIFHVGVPIETNDVYNILSKHLTLALFLGH